MMTIFFLSFIFVLRKCISTLILIRFKPDRDTEFNSNCELEKNKLLLVVSSDVIMKMTISDC